MHICLKFTWFQYTHSHPPWIHFSSKCIWKSLHTILGYTVGWQEVEWQTTCFFFFWNYKKYIRNKKAITKKFSTISFPAHSILFLEAGRFLAFLSRFSNSATRWLSMWKRTPLWLSCVISVNYWWIKPRENQSLLRVGNNRRSEVIERDSRTETSERAFFSLACPPCAPSSFLRPYYLQAHS